MKNKMHSLIRVLLLLICLTILVTSCARQDNTEMNTNLPDTHSVTTNADAPTQESAPKDEWTLLREKAQKRGIKVLFIGNSLTYYNEMPELFENLCILDGKIVDAERLTYAGQNIVMMKEDETMWSEIDTKLTSKAWDVVVFQTDRNGVVMEEFFPDYPLKGYKAAKELATKIRDAGAIPVIYSTFGVNKGSLTFQNYTKENITSVELSNLVIAYDAAVAQKLNCKVVYAGSTFNSVLASNPEINLFHTDERHPSLAGSVLIACDFYTVLFGQSPEHIRFKGGLDSEETAAVLRKAAANLLTYTPRTVATINGAN